MSCLFFTMVFYYYKKLNTQKQSQRVFLCETNELKNPMLIRNRL